MAKINIAVDGHSSCGKSTIARALAEKLNYLYVDSGAMYRSVTYYAIENGFVKHEVIDIKRLLHNLSKITINFKRVNGVQHAFLNDVDIEFHIRSQEISDVVSQIAKIPEVRKFLVKQQKKMGEQKGVVMDGRDIGTVVFPTAEVKFFVTANVDVRAQRRFDEMQSKGYEKVSLADIKRNLEERDFVDSHRAVSPLIQANDAILIDTSNLSLDEQLALTFDFAEKVINAQA